MSKLSRAFTVLSSFVALAAFSGGCSSASEDEVVTPKFEIVNKTKSALTAGDITSVTGTYSAACSGRSALGTETWLVDITTPANTNLTVRKNDGDCILTVENIVTAGGAFIGAPAIALNTIDTYKVSGSAFALFEGSLAFYGNAKISALTFGADFTITMLVSDDPSSTAPDDVPTAGFATQSGSVSASTLAPPGYTLGFGGMTVTKDADNVVQSTAGIAQLSAAGVTGEDYAVHVGNLTGATFAVVDAAYAASVTKGTLESLTTNQLPAAAFTLETADLDTATYRTVIIRRTVSGVSAYQYFSVLFN